MPEHGGTVLTVEFSIGTQSFLALNAGPGAPATDTISFQIPCEDQKSIDYYWERLTADGGAEGKCGWCRDKFGVAWQVVYTRLGELMKDPETAGPVTAVLRSQTKLIVADLENAAQLPR